MAAQEENKQIPQTTASEGGRSQLCSGALHPIINVFPSAAAISAGAHRVTDLMEKSFVS